MDIQRIIVGLLIVVLASWFVTSLVIGINFVRDARRNPAQVMQSLFGGQLQGKAVYFSPKGHTVIREPTPYMIAIFEPPPRGCGGCGKCSAHADPPEGPD